jgi:hypothetical protein
MFNVRRRSIQASNGEDLRVLPQTEAQISGAAPDIEHPYRSGYSGKSDKQGC